MSKRKIIDNVHVEVWPDIGWKNNLAQRTAGESELDFSQRVAKDAKQMCLWIIDEIKKHVDDITNVSVNYDTLEVCEHCGSAWTEDSADYNGGCCRKDQEPENAREAAAKEQTK